MVLLDLKEMFMDIFMTGWYLTNGATPMYITSRYVWNTRTTLPSNYRFYKIISEVFNIYSRVNKRKRVERWNQGRPPELTGRVDSSNARRQPLLALQCTCRITAITPHFQCGDEGSTPSTCLSLRSSIGIEQPASTRLVGGSNPSGET